MGSESLIQGINDSDPIDFGPFVNISWFQMDRFDSVGKTANIVA